MGSLVQKGPHHQIPAETDEGTQGMHISEGVLSPGVLVAGVTLTVMGTAVGLKRIDTEEIPSVGILSAAFFVASLVHVPVGPVSAHLVLNGLLGFILGWKAFPAILVGLALQGLLFQYGGLTSLGVNTFNMAMPAVACYHLFGWAANGCHGRVTLTIGAFACGSVAVLISGLLVAASLSLTGDAFVPAAKVVVVGHLPIMIIEGTLTAACALFLRKVKPELLEGRYAGRYT